MNELHRNSSKSVITAALDLMIQGDVTGTTCWRAIKRLGREIRSEWTPVEKWVWKELLDALGSWGENGFLAGCFVSDEDLRNLWAVRWLCETGDPHADWGWLDGITEPSLSADGLDLVGKIAKRCPDVPTEVPLQVRLRCLLGILSQVEDSVEHVNAPVRLFLTMVIADKPWLDPVERRAREHFLAIGKSKKDERGRIEKLQREVATRYFEVVATSHQRKDKL
ncbi:MAG: hypothetical protein IH851_08365 [Armatimonadetes bacterium]|nr:hypothetical protein [Armatimonadota bacterium]